MAIAFTNLTSSVSSGGGTSTQTFLTSSISPIADVPVVVAIVNARNGAVPAELPTLTGAGITFSLISSVNATGSGPLRLSVFRGSNAAPSVDVLTIGFSSGQSAAGWAVDQVTGANFGSLVVQSSATSTPANSTATVELAAFGSTSNGVYAAFGVNGNILLTPDGNTVQLSWASSSIAGYRVQVLSQWTHVNESSVSVAESGAARSILIASEIAAAPVVSGGAHYQQYYLSQVALC